jgi:hypothetical protein
MSEWEVLSSGIAKDASTEREYYQIIDFDIAITTISGDQTKAGAGIFAGGFGLGAQGIIENKDSSVSRMKFAIPVLFPKQSVPPETPISHLPDVPTERCK